MLSVLPKGALIATVPRTRGVQAEVNRIVHEAEDAGAVVAVPLHFAQVRGERIEPRRNRINPRVVKRKMSKFAKKRPQHRGGPLLKKTFAQTVLIT